MSAKSFILTALFEAFWIPQMYPESIKNRSSRSSWAKRAPGISQQGSKNRFNSIFHRCFIDLGVDGSGSCNPPHSHCKFRPSRTNEDKNVELPMWGLEANFNPNKHPRGNTRYNKMERIYSPWGTHDSRLHNPSHIFKVSHCHLCNDSTGNTQPLI